MTTLEMIDLLNMALQHERKHFNFYLQAMLTLVGPERLYLLPLLEKEMHGELEHIRLFGDKILSLGGTPGVEVPPYPSHIRRMDEVLKTAIEFEREVLAVYHKMYPLAEQYNEEHNDMSIVLLLEDQIEDSTKDVEEMEKLRRKANLS